MDSHEEKNELVIEEDDEDGGWVDTHHYAGRNVGSQYLSVAWNSPNLWSFVSSAG